MFKADIGDFLYFIILLVLVFAGGIEKYIKGKKQEAQKQHLPTSDELAGDEDDFEEVGQESSSPQHLEEVLKRMFQEVEPQAKEYIPYFEEEAQSLEIIPEGKTDNYLENNQINISEEEKMIYSPVSEEVSVSESDASSHEEFDFDIRKAIIASEILNRKY
ncbi:MAG: hypothetical protein LBQ60_12685 [Bacteroidales bacterium]|jgi:hypothetical protein|nr:hypothetical protein [Bacteroidales bacterium]